jgi:argininosuccinate lyase
MNPHPHSPSSAKPWEHAKSGEGSASDPLAARFVESLSYDRRLYRHDIAGSIAHAGMLRSVGLLTADELAAVERGLREIEAEIDASGPDYGAAWSGWRTELEDVHMCIEAALIEKVGDPGRKLHTGRSRNDQVALDLMCWIDEAADEVIGLTEKLCDAFRELAREQGDVVMPSYTHLQRAQPVCVGGELMAWATALDRCAERVHFAVLVGNRTNPLGSGAIAGSALPLDRDAVALEFPQGGPASMSSIDSTASRDMAVDFVYALAMTAQWLSRWAEQWIIYCSTEFSFIALDPRYTTGSSMMPQKRNPDMLELIRGRCGNLYGHLTALLTLLKGLPIGYNRDLQEDKRHVFAAYDTLRDMLEMATRIVATTRFQADRIARTLDQGFLDATSLAEYLVTRGMPFRTAHQAVGSLVRLVESRGLHALSQLALTDFNDACAQRGKPGLCGDDVYQWLGAANVVARYRTKGNAGLSGYRAALEHWHDTDGGDTHQAPDEPAPSA